MRYLLDLLVKGLAIMGLMDPAVQDIIPGDQWIEVVLLCLLLEERAKAGDLLRILLRQIDALGVPSRPHRRAWQRSRNDLYTQYGPNATAIRALGLGTAALTTRCLPF